MTQKKDYNPANPDQGNGRTMLERMNNSHQYLRDQFFPMIPWKDEMTMLDVGCGGGETVRQMLGMSRDSIVYGIDYSETAVEYSRENNKDQLNSRVFIEQADVASLPFDSDKFNIVTAMETTYFWPDVPAGMKEIHRVLKDKGVFAIILEAVTPGLHQDWDRSYGEINIWTVEELTKMLKYAGFSSVSAHRGTEDSALILGYK